MCVWFTGGTIPSAFSAGYLKPIKPQTMFNVIQRKKDSDGLATAGFFNPRVSKTPFSKWYVKGYSASAAMIKIIQAIINKTTEELNKNLKTHAKNISKIFVNNKIIYDVCTC